MFDSKRDRAIKSDLSGDPASSIPAPFFPLDDFTDQENLGHDLFYGAESLLNPADNPNPAFPNPNFPVPEFIPTSAGCGVFCHRSNAGTDPLGVSLDERYTGDGFFNIGTPHNVEIPGNPASDIGLAHTTGQPRHTGAHKAPTLRNVDKRRGKGFKKAYTHNGWFKSLESLVHFYNTSTIGGTTAGLMGVTRCPDDVVTEKQALANNCWPEPEFDGRRPDGPAAGVIRGFIGDRGLSLEEEAAIVSYLKTLTDISTAKAPKPFNLKKYLNEQPF
jgi:cytochrome c peroxidase